MVRFILVSFAFLGWVFWELSGGADYEPRIVAEPIFAPIAPLEDRSRVADARTGPSASPYEEPRPAAMAQLSTRSTVAPAMRETANNPQPATDMQTRTDLLVQAALNADVSPPPAETAPETEETRLSVVFQAQPILEISTAGLSVEGLRGTPGTQATQGTTGALTGQVITFSSIGTTETLSPTADAPAPVAGAGQPDMREISGDRVNMRAGPGTDYPVMTRLIRGNTVEIIGAEEGGWLRLRVPATGQVGYMADWLVSARAE